jgi:alanine-glyoxylate transaminase/(R)-3-amino-2-methylpropionate-pyruvate transaminase
MGGGGAVARARRLLRLSTISSCRRGLSLAADASRELEGGAPQMPPFDFTPQPYTGPKADEVLAKRKKFLNPALFLYYKKPVSRAMAISFLQIRSSHGLGIQSWRNVHV